MIHLSLQTYYAKRLTSLCFISIVKKRHLLLPILEFHINKNKKKEKRKYKNILEEDKKKYISGKSITECPKNYRKLVEED
jgi:hypothetical protein